MPDVLDTEVATLKKRKSELLKELNKIDRALISLTGTEEKSWSKRALDCIRNWDEFLTSTEILECMFFKREYMLKDAEQRKKYTVALSVGLTQLIKKGIVAKISSPGFKGNFYGLSEWKKDGKPIGKYYKKLQKKTYGKIEYQTI
jgi:hypothetical protein